MNSVVAVMDCDNDHSDKEEDWFDPEKMEAQIPDVAYAVTYSRHNWKQKGKKTPRPRFHVYFRIRPCSNAEEYKELKEKSYGLLDKLAQYCQKGKLQVSPIRQAVRYIEEHYTEEITLNSLAEMYHYSPNYFSSIFKAYTGETLISFVNRLRMEKAVEYMPVKNMKNMEIANRVGIMDYKYFNKLFKKRYGMSVQKFRDQMLEKGEMPDE